LVVKFGDLGREGGEAPHPLLLDEIFSVVIFIIHHSRLVTRQTNVASVD
jgi:hypothetical protein